MEILKTVICALILGAGHVVRGRCSTAEHGRRRRLHLFCQSPQQTLPSGFLQDQRKPGLCISLSHALTRLLYSKHRVIRIRGDRNKFKLCENLT